MFFAPPKVKSLSRYAEYGAYLGHRHFLIMIIIAMSIHVVVFWIYSLLPTEEVIKVPVRVLNIKLASGGAGNGGSIRVPTPAASVPVAKPPAPAAPQQQAIVQDADEEIEQLQEEEMAQPVRPQVTKTPVKPAPRLPARPAMAKRERAQHAVKAKHEEEQVPSPELTLGTPKKFVREAAASAHYEAGVGHGKGNGNDSEVLGEIGGKEIVTKYTQTISQWIQNHQIYAKAACGEGAAIVGGQCNAKGTVTVRLRIDRNGRILSHSVDRTSGQDLLDQAAIEMVKASDPLPAVPTNFPENQLEFLIAVQVDLAAKH